MNLTESKISDVIDKPISGEWGDELAPNEKGIAVIRNANFTNEGKINWGKGIAQRKISPDKIDRKKLEYGDTIIEKSGGSPNQPVGRVVYFDNKSNEEYTCSNFTSILRPNNRVIPKYLFYYLFFLYNSRVTTLFQNKTTGIINLQLKRYLSKAKIPLPPLAEQKRIAVILDKADALRTRTRAQLAAYDELLQAVFLEMFGDPVLNEKGWEVKPMKEVVERIQIGPFGSQLHKSDYIQGGIPLINPSNILNQKIKIDEEVSITEPLFSKLSQYNLIENDVVIARRGEMGRCAVVKKDHGKLFCGTGSLFIRTNKRLILPEYLQAFLSSTNIIKFLHNKARGVTMMNLNKKIIGSLEIPVPPCSLQKKYVKSIRLNDQVSKLNKEALTQSDDLFNSLLQRAFRGEL